MRARQDSRARQAGPGAEPADLGRVREHVDELMQDAARFISPGKVEQTARGWLADETIGPDWAGLAVAMA